VLLALLAQACIGSTAAPELGELEPAAAVYARVASGPEKRAERGSCYAAFDDVADAWEALVGPLEPECRSVADGFELRLVPTVPCSAPGGGPVDGCAVHEEQAVYILEDASPAGQVFVAAHEWVHVLADCALGDSDHDHRDAGLWSLEAGVLGLATEDLPVGPCLEAPAP
jgi:hypothetical protein